MAEMFYDDDANLAVLQERSVAIIGYGSQGHAHALNLRDSGIEVCVGLAEGSKSRDKAEAEGLRVLTPAQAAAESDVIMILVPDQVQRHVYANEIAPNLNPGDAIFFAHGFNIRFGYITAPDGVDVCMVAPKGPRHIVRREYADGRGVPVVWQSKSASGQAWPLALSYAKAIGGLRAGGSGPPSPRRPRPTCSVSRRCCAAACRTWCGRVRHPGRRPATSQVAYSSACTN